MSFVELRTHSAFSFGDGTASPEALVSRAADLGYAALGLTDSADLGGIIRFTLEAERCGIKPICGAELNVDGYPTAFLACDQTGYRNLAHLVTQARVGAINTWGEPEIAHANAHAHDYVNHKRGHNLNKRYAVPLPERGRPNISFQDVIEHSEGLFCLTGASTGELATLLATGRKVEADYELDRWRNVFGHRLAVEVQVHHAGGHKAALATSLIEMVERNRVTWFRHQRSSLSRHQRPGRARSAHRQPRRCVHHHRGPAGLLLANGEWRLNRRTSACVNRSGNSFRGMA